jgi:tRNA modification GTPase
MMLDAGRSAGFHFQGPNSYTGENTIEISCHGFYLYPATNNPIVASQRMPYGDPGEFTLKSFLNGKLDLRRKQWPI